jgi:hypothetical protein
MSPTRRELFVALEEMSERYPEWRLGQMLANIADWAKQPADPGAGAAAIWDIEDQELVDCIRRHFERQHFHSNSGKWPSE